VNPQAPAPDTAASPEALYRAYLQTCRETVRNARFEDGSLEANLWDSLRSHVHWELSVLGRVSGHLTEMDDRQNERFTHVLAFLQGTLDFCEAGSLSLVESLAEQGRMTVTHLKLGGLLSPAYTEGPPPPYLVVRAARQAAVTPGTAAAPGTDAAPGTA